MSVNQIYLLGRCGKDAEVRMAGQNKVATFSLCTGGKYKTNDGREIDDTAWHSIVAWRNLAELAEKYIRKGSQILVIGRLTYRKYTGNDGVERNVTEIIADKIELCGARESAPSQSPAPSPAPARPQYQTTQMPAAGEPEDGDLPF
jgi:single-strand DNA-binding protein